MARHVIRARRRSSFSNDGLRGRWLIEMRDGDELARAVARARARNPWVLGIGALLFVIGIAYSFWAVRQLRDAPWAGDGFDRPIARLALLFTAEEARLRQVPTETPREERLLGALRANADLTARLAVFVVRIFLGTVPVTTGLILAAIALTDRGWLGRLARAPSPGAHG
jgi:hypothetical protein